MGFQMSEFEFQTFLFFFCPPPYLGKSPQFSRFLIMTAPLNIVDIAPGIYFLEFFTIS